MALVCALAMAFCPLGAELCALATEGCLGVPGGTLTDAAVGTPSARLSVDEPHFSGLGARRGMVGPHVKKLPNGPA